MHEVRRFLSFSTEQRTLPSASYYIPGVQNIFPHNIHFWTRIENCCCDSRASSTVPPNKEIAESVQKRCKRDFSRNVSDDRNEATRISVAGSPSDRHFKEKLDSRLIYFVPRFSTLIRDPRAPAGSTRPLVSTGEDTFEKLAGLIGSERRAPPSGKFSGHFRV